MILWGPGALGRAALRELLRRPEFDVVAAVGYGAESIGRDIGELVGQPPVGVAVTAYADKQTVIDMDADCVLWAGMFPFPQIAEQMDRDVISLLESGKNVISATTYHYLPAQGADYLAKFEKACRNGNSSLFGTGENPGFWFERVALTLTGMCTDVDYVELSEYADCEGSGSSPEFLTGCGFALSPQDAAELKTLAAVWDERYFVESLSFASTALYGKPLEKFERDATFYATDEELVFDTQRGDRIDLVVPKGHVKAQMHHFRGYVDGVVKLSIKTYWFLADRTSPFTGKNDNTWEIRIDGSPASLTSSFEVRTTAFDPEDRTTATWYITALTMIQGIPKVCAHEPGIVYPTVFAHGASDFRMLESS
ncbi:hypothetical protein D0Z08_03725 [Nocardioides immobilis]|uniref:Dihydrodipicolinate reductase n=1 Tax=Nocardioides immobilis TaxID=2049295 RepID=A0A417Y5Z8_9ACTN|nr:hypothetical protein D0Z08_03725 [Nocardioides immobilis]